MDATNTSLQEYVSEERPRYRHTSLEFRRRKVLELVTSLGIGATDFESWYKLEAEDFRRKKLRTLLMAHGDSVSKTLMDLFPEHKWDVDKFKYPRNYWLNIDNQRAFVLKLGKKLGIPENQYEEWYKVQKKDVISHGGGVLIRRHNGSISGLLKTVFPEHEWDDAKFTKKPRNHWASLQNQRAFFATLGAKLGIDNDDLEAWYKVSPSVIEEHGGRHMLQQCGSYVDLLRTIFPDHVWDPFKFKSVVGISRRRIPDLMNQSESSPITDMLV